MKPFALLICCACAFAQPQVDSLFVFEDQQGYFDQALPLPDGGYILSGAAFEDIPYSWRFARISSTREILWHRDVSSSVAFKRNRLLVDGEWLVGVGRRSIPLDSNSWTTRDIAIKYSLSGDSIWERTYEDPVNYTALASIIPDGSGGYFILGTESVLAGEAYNQQIRLTRTDGDGEVLWEQFFGRESLDQPGTLVKLDGDSLLLATVMRFGSTDRVVFLWTDLDGDSLTSRTYGDLGHVSLWQPTELESRDGGWEFVWHDAIAGGADLDVLRWLRTDYEGNHEIELALEAPVNTFNGLCQTDDGLLTIGFSPWNAPDRDIVLGRLNGSGRWYYRDPVLIEMSQEAYGFIPLQNGAVAATGRTRLNDSTFGACIYYLNDNLHSSYLFSVPSEIDFGVVPLHEVGLLELALVVSWDSAVTVSEIVVPEFMTTSLSPPVSVVPGESLFFQLGFRPEQLTRYSDSVQVYSNANNDVLTIEIRGEAPFAECTPAFSTVNFSWAAIGDSIRRPFAVFNTGTLPLHIDTIVEPLPFHLDIPGPFVVAPDTAQLFWITFRPDSVLEYEVNLVLRSDDPQGADTVRLRGRGLAGPNDTGELPGLPSEFKLHAPYPNPFNSTAVIRFELPKTQLVKLELFDITGRLVKDVMKQTFDAGEHQIVIDGSGLASGIYFANLEAGENHVVQKLLLVR